MNYKIIYKDYDFYHSPFSIFWEQRELGNLGEFKSNGVDKLSKPNEIPVNQLNYMDIYNKRFIANKNTCNLMQVTSKSNPPITKLNATK